MIYWWLGDKDKIVMNLIKIMEENQYLDWK
jgi:hypothetical protein